MDNSNCNRCGKLLRVNEGKAVWVDTGHAILACDQCGQEVYGERLGAVRNLIYGGNNPYSEQHAGQTPGPLFDNYNNRNDL